MFNVLKIVLLDSRYILKFKLKVKVKVKLEICRKIEYRTWY